METDFIIPLLVYQNAATQICSSCYKPLRNGRTIAAGVRRHEEIGGTLCFYYLVRCAECTNCTEITLARPITRPDWWQQIAEWARNPPTNRVTGLSYMAPLKGLRLVVKLRGIKQFQLFGAYRGEVGPVLLLYRRVHAGPRCEHNIARLEKNDQIHLDWVHPDESLSPDRWPWFASLELGSGFEHSGRHWIKMSRDEIERIVRDRVYKPIRNSTRQP